MKSLVIGLGILHIKYESMDYIESKGINVLRDSLPGASRNCDTTLQGGKKCGVADNHIFKCLLFQKLIINFLLGFSFLNQPA